MKTILIIGGGIGGLALSLFLAKAGIKSEVYEAHAYRDDIGGGLNIAPNGMNILDEIDLATILYARGSIALENTFLNEKGKVLARFVNLNPEKYGLPAVSLLRSELFNVLLEACTQRGINVNFKKRLNNIKQDENKVTAFFEDGTSVSGDILIGADGVNSKVRELIFPEAPKPAYVGIIAAGGKVKSGDVPMVTTREKQSLNFNFGPKGFFGYMGINSSEIMWWANLPYEQQLSAQELSALTIDEVKLQMGELFKDFNPTVRALISNSYSTLAYNIFDIQSLKKWYAGRVLLIGDAAHAVSPNAGQGASMALEDAMYLAKLLKNNLTDPETLFSTFELARKERAEKIVNEGRKRGLDKKELTPRQAKFRDVFISVLFGLFGPKLQAWVYNYKIKW